MPTQCIGAIFHFSTLTLPVWNSCWAGDISVRVLLPLDPSARGAWLKLSSYAFFFVQKISKLTETELRAPFYTYQPIHNISTNSLCNFSGNISVSFFLHPLSCSLKRYNMKCQARVEDDDQSCWIRSPPSIKLWSEESSELVQLPNKGQRMVLVTLTFKVGKSWWGNEEASC